MNRIVLAAVMAAMLAGCRGGSKAAQDDSIAPVGEPAWVKAALESGPADEEQPPVKAEPVKAEPVKEPAPAVVPPEPKPEPVKPEPATGGGAVAVPDIAPIIPWHLFDSTASVIRELRPDPPEPPPEPKPEPNPEPKPEPAIEVSAEKPAPVNVIPDPPVVDLAKPVPDPQDLPQSPLPAAKPESAKSGLRIVLDDAYVQSQATVAAGGSVTLKVFMFKGCIFCNSEAIQKAAAAEGLERYVEVIDITKQDVRRYNLPVNESGDRLVPYYMIVDQEADGRERVIARFGPKRYAWEQLRSELVKHIPQDTDVADQMVGAIKAGKIEGGAEPVKKIIATARELLGDNGSISVAYKKPGVSGYFETDKLGTPIRIGAQTTLGWTCSGDTLKLTINPPIKARVFPLYWVLIDHITLSADRADVSVLRGPDVYLQIE